MAAKKRGKKGQDTVIDLNIDVNKTLTVIKTVRNGAVALTKWILKKYQP